MPIYIYQCDNCTHRTETFQHMFEDNITICPICNSDKFHRVPCLPNTPHTEYCDPIEMHSIALCHHDDIQAFKQRHPNVTCSDTPDDPLYGVPIAHSRKEKLDILKGEGWEERN